MNAEHSGFSSNTLQDDSSSVHEVSLQAHLVVENGVRLNHSRRKHASLQPIGHAVIVEVRPTKKRIWMVIALAALVLIVTVVTVLLVFPFRPGSSTVPTSDTTNKQHDTPNATDSESIPSSGTAATWETNDGFFTSTQQLYDAVDAYMDAISSGADVKSSDMVIQYGYPIGTWDVSRLTDFSRVFDPNRSHPLDQFRESVGPGSFNEDLEGWDMSNAVSIEGMFACANAFVGTGLDLWNVGKVTKFAYAFAQATVFQGNISFWNTSNANTMEAMFLDAQHFNGDISRFDVSQVESMSLMFWFSAAFEGLGGLELWDVSSVRTMHQMFAFTSSFHGSIATWDTSQVTDMSFMFWGADFNGDLSNWRTGNVQTMDSMFYEARQFEGGNLSGWNTSSVTNMTSTFAYASTFNGDISSWDVSKVISFSATFWGCAVFNGDLSQWNTSSATSMDLMFSNALAFDEDISSWDTSKVYFAQFMFHNAIKFNSNLSSWNVSSLFDASSMFSKASSFNQSLCTWGAYLSQDTAMSSIFSSSGCLDSSEPVLPSDGEMPVSLCRRCVKS